MVIWRYIITEWLDPGLQNPLNRCLKTASPMYACLICKLQHNQDSWLSSFSRPVGTGHLKVTSETHAAVGCGSIRRKHKDT